MAATLQTVKPARENWNDQYTIDIDQHDEGWIIFKQGSEWISIPQEALPELIEKLQRVAELVLK